MRQEDPRKQPLIRFARFARAAIDRLATTGLFAIIASVIAGECGRMHWFPDLFSHFQVQYLLLASVALVWFSVRRMWRAAAVGIVLIICTTFRISPLWLDSGSRSDTTANLRLMSANVLVGNREYDRVLQLVRMEKPDVVVFQEVSPEWATELSQLSDEYPFAKTVPRKDAFGMSVYSRHPMKRLEVRLVDQVPWLELEIEVEGQTTRILGAHTLPPVFHKYWSVRNRQLDYVVRTANRAAEDGVPLVVMGDLNCTPWSPHLRDTISRSGLTSARLGFGLKTSWPVAKPALWIPIDHILMSPEVRVREFRALEDVGSDHRPIIADVHIPTE